MFDWHRPQSEIGAVRPSRLWLPTPRELPYSRLREIRDAVLNLVYPQDCLICGVPVARYRPSRRPMPGAVKAWNYPASWVRRWVKGNGEISWRGRRRFVGEAFVRDYVGLKPVRPGVWRVYFGPKLVGELHEKEQGNIRTARYRLRRKSAAARPHSGSLRSPPRHPSTQSVTHQVRTFVTYQVRTPKASPHHFQRDSPSIDFSGNVASGQRWAAKRNAKRGLTS